MDAITAIGLAAGILQFVDFAAKAISHTIGLHKSGKEALENHLTIEAAILRLTELGNNLKAGAFSGGSNTPKQLETVITACLEDAAKLHNALSVCKRKGDNRRSLVYAAIRSVLGDKNIEALQVRLDRYRQEIDTYLLVSHRRDIIGIATVMEQSQQVNRADQQRIKDALGALQTGYDSAQADWSRQIKAMEMILLAVVDNLKNNDLHTRLAAIQLKMDELSVKEDSQQSLQILNDLSSRNTIHHLTTQHDISKVQEAILNIQQQQQARSQDLAESVANRQQRFLDDLYHPVLTRREKQVVDRAEDTFEWIFNGAIEHYKHAKYSWSTGYMDWLIGNQSLYWISGKPGAGKSTLMKFIAQDSRTRTALEQWTGPVTLIIATAYFWISGDPLQRSVCGLLRCLLHQILSHCRDLLPVLFPREWRLYNRDDYQQVQWTEEDLISAIETLNTLQNLKYRFCLFIDGLDEYEGIHDLDWLNRFFIKLSKSSHMKLCVSSRPWQDFELAFSRIPSIKIDEWTAEDIRVFIHQELEQHPYWSDIVTLSPDNSAQILSVTADRAEGVFLWVFLVVRLIKEGITAGESTEQLLQRINEMPQGLEAYFGRIMAQLRPEDRRKTAKVLWVCLHANPLWLSWLHYLDEENPNFGENTPLRSYTLEQLNARGRVLERFVATCCKDLLYVYEDPYHGNFKVFWAEVVFTHRSVRDYLETAQARSMLEFPDMHLLEFANWSYQVLLMEVKSLSGLHLEVPLGAVLEALVQAFGCQKVWLYGYEPSISYLDDLYHSIQSVHSNGKSDADLFSRWITDEFYGVFKHFLSWTAFLGFKDYVRTKMLAKEFYMNIGDLEEVIEGVNHLEHSMLRSRPQCTGGLVAIKDILAVIQQASRNLFDQGLNSQYLEIKNVSTRHNNTDLDAWEVFAVDCSGKNL